MVPKKIPMWVAWLVIIAMGAAVVYMNTLGAK